MGHPPAPSLWSTEARGVLAGLGLLAGFALLASGWSTRTDPGSPTAPPPRLVLDPNTAPPEVLSALPGIGPGLAGKIVEAREHRRFRSLNEIERRVKGIGPVTLGRIAPYLRIPGPDSDPDPAPAR